MIQSGEIEEARTHLKQRFPKLYEQNISVRAFLDGLAFIEFIDEGDMQGAIDFAQNTISKYGKTVTFPTIRNDEEEDIFIGDILGLLCYTEPENSEWGFLMSPNQKRLIANKLNNELLKHANKAHFKKTGACSNLEIVVKQLSVCQ